MRDRMITIVKTEAKTIIVALMNQKENKYKSSVESIKSYLVVDKF
jgi:hypothetical protein